MSKIEGKIKVEKGVAVDAADLLGEIAAASGCDAARKDAAARYFALADGWKEASAALGGAFARPSRNDG